MCLCEEEKSKDEEKWKYNQGLLEHKNVRSWWLKQVLKTTRTQMPSKRRGVMIIAVEEKDTFRRSILNYCGELTLACVITHKQIALSKCDNMKKKPFILSDIMMLQSF